MQNETIIEKVKALLGKTVENGATEAEAASAVSAAYKLISKHGLDIETIMETHKKDNYVFRRTRVFHKNGSVYDDYMAVSIANFAGVAVFYQNYQGKKTLTFFGEEADCEFAELVRNIFILTARKIYKTFCKENGIEGDDRYGKIQKAYNVSYCARMRERIAEMMKVEEDRMVEENRTAANGTSLIVLKNQLVTEALASRMKLETAKQARTYKKKYTAAEIEAYYAGQNAANNTVIPANNDGTERALDKV